MRVTKKEIDSFLETRKLAIAGVSRKEKKFGYTVYMDLKEKGFDVYPINPNTDTLNGQTCFRSVSALPADVTKLVVLTKKPETLGILREAFDKGIKEVWIQQMSDTPEALNFSVAHFKTFIYKQCILMHTDPVKSIHKFHRSIKGFFGTLPK